MNSKDLTLTICLIVTLIFGNSAVYAGCKKRKLIECNAVLPVDFRVCAKQRFEWECLVPAPNSDKGAELKKNYFGQHAENPNDDDSSEGGQEPCWVECRCKWDADEGICKCRTDFGMGPVHTKSVFDYEACHTHGGGGGGGGTPTDPT